MEASRLHSIQQRWLQYPEADIIVAGGRGMGSKENFDKLYELADAIDCVLGATTPTR